MFAFESFPLHDFWIDSFLLFSIALSVSLSLSLCNHDGFKLIFKRKWEIAMIRGLIGNFGLNLRVRFRCELFCLFFRFSIWILIVSLRIWLLLRVFCLMIFRLMPFYRFHVFTTDSTWFWMKIWISAVFRGLAVDFGMTLITDLSRNFFLLPSWFFFLDLDRVNLVNWLV